LNFDTLCYLLQKLF